MTEFGWRLWTCVSPGDFDAYHRAWWRMIKPVIFPVAAVAFLGSAALIWWRPEGVTAVLVWPRIRHARQPDGSLDPLYALTMRTHWIRGALITANGLLVFWMQWPFIVLSLWCTGAKRYNL